MSFDAESDDTRTAIAREASRSIPAGIAFAEITPQMAAFVRDLIAKGKITDHPTTPPLEPA